MKTAEELVTSILLKAFVGYDKDGFACQMKFPEFVKALAEHDKEIVEMIDKFYDVALEGIESVGSANYAHIQAEAVQKLLKELSELKKEILK